jgi:SAM-dependent methyltransferase
MRTSQKDNRTLEQEILRISDGGERVTHLRPNGCYLAHLSIYRFALQFVQASIVLDMGSGSGYGTAYLAENGAAFVEGIDVSDTAVAFSQQYFTLENVRYRVGDLQHIAGFEDGAFDVIFSSNTFEHVPNILAAWREVWRLMKPDGWFILAVPPIVDESTRAMNVSNPFHLNIWSPRQWHHILSLYFNGVQPYSHIFAKPGPPPDFFAAPEKTNFSEKDFTFEPISVDDMYHVPSMTAIFVARDPRPAHEIPQSENEIPFVDDSFSRSLLSALRERYPLLVTQYFQLNEEYQRLRAQLTKINEGFVMRVLNKGGSFFHSFKGQFIKLKSML